MSDFPRKAFDYYLFKNDHGTVVALVTDLRQAIKAYDELSLRCVEDRTRDSLRIAELRAEIATLKGEASEPDPLQLSTEL